MGNYTATPKDTKTVEIFAVKPNVDSILEMKLAETTKDAEAMKLLFLMYRFDISGVTATRASGTYMVYDPDVKTTAANGQKTSASTTRQQPYPLRGVRPGPRKPLCSLP